MRTPNNKNIKNKKNSALAVNPPPQAPVHIGSHQSVLQADELSRALYSCSMMGRKIIAYAATRIEEKRIDETPFGTGVPLGIFVPAAEFSISNLLKVLKLTKCGKNYDLIKNTVVELRTAGIEILNDRKHYKAYNWFQSVHYDKDKDKIEFHFTDDIGWTLYNFKTGYSALNLHTIGEFRSFYAFRFYEIALSWRGMRGRNGNRKNEWFFQMGIQEIRNTFKIGDEKYKGRMNNFIEYVIKKPLDELNTVNKDFTISFAKVMRDRDLVAIRFECADTPKEQEKAAIKKTDSIEDKTLKKEMNAEQEELAQLIKENPIEWQELMNEEVEKPENWSSRKVHEGKFLESVAKASAGLALMKAHGKKVDDDVPEGQLALF